MSSHVVGIRAVEALLTHDPERVVRVLHTDKLDGARRRVIDQASALSIEHETASGKQLDALADGLRHQGIIAVISDKPPADWKALIEQDQALLVAFDQVTDPRNLGAILRSAEAFGADGAMVTRNRCARPGPIVTRTSAGASELMDIAVETNLARALRQARDAGMQIIGADLEGLPPGEVDLTGPVVLVIGAEGQGLRRLTKTLCDQRIRIPITGATESLNASVAASILLYEARRQRDLAISEQPITTTDASQDSHATG
jgi:23S rRNA (guanosine2251-2'-O)-methyltransferase